MQAWPAAPCTAASIWSLPSEQAADATKSECGQRCPEVGTTVVSWALQVRQLLCRAPETDHSSELTPAAEAVTHDLWVVGRRHRV